MEINKDWIDEQFIGAKIKVKVGKAVLKVLADWDAGKLTDEEVEEVFSISSKLARGHALLPATTYTWVDAMPGQIKVGDVVRVKHDAFSGELGMSHNGREGIIVAIRSGDVIFRSNDDKKPLLDGTHYSPYKLQKRVK